MGQGMLKIQGNGEIVFTSSGRFRPDDVTEPSALLAAEPARTRPSHE